MKLASTFILIFITTFIFAQKHDYQWQLGGYESGTDDPQDTLFGITNINFQDSLSSPYVYYSDEIFVRYQITNSTISDSLGNYLFTYNGKHIQDMSGEVMQNGENLSESGDESGNVLPQGGLILPLPASKNIYILFHQDWKYIDPRIARTGHKLYYSLIDMEGNEGRGSVILRKKLLVQDTMDLGKLTATKHANGRDWWVIIPKYNSDKYFRLLVTPSNVELLSLESTGLVHKTGSGQVHFSQDGTKYVSYFGSNEHYGAFIYLYDFDRCSGSLSNPQTYDFYPGRYEAGSVCFSPNSSFLYLFKHDEIYQYDLSKKDVFQDKVLVGVKDDYLDHIPGTNFYSSYSFYNTQLGPDGKLYIISFGPNRLVSTIDYPDRPGENCKVNPHSVHLNTFNTSIPNFPNYRLGPIDGSPCDTLGRNNFPLARFRMDQDTSDYLNFQFVDLSNYEPKKWSWDFGDGNTSTAINPVHTYSRSGTYEVCLKVSNDYGSHTACKTLHLGTLSSSGTPGTVNITLYPNPCRSHFYIHWRDAFPKKAMLTLFDMKGSAVKVQQLYYGQNMIDISVLSSGIYFYEITENGHNLKSGKMIKGK